MDRDHICYEDVFFDYDPEQPILRGVSFEIQPGETALLAGPNGAGKTTLVGLLPRFFEPARGRITINGEPVESFRLKDLRRQIAFVSQDTYLFSESIYDNIRLSKPSASYREVLAAAELANVLEFSEQLAEGLDTEVGERGCRLSGGQRQRISIARAILKGSDILVLDEASSAVDSKTEIFLHEALAGLMKGRTTIVIAHHSSNFIHRVDRRFVLNDGQVRELIMSQD